MRLSLLKAARAAVGECHVAGNPGRPSYSTHVRESPRTWGTRPGDKAGEQARDLSHNQPITLPPLRSPSRLFIPLGSAVRLVKQYPWNGARTAFPLASPC